MEKLNSILSITVFICLFIFLAAGSGRSSSVKLSVVPAGALPENIPKLTARCEPTKPREWKYITYITIFRFANKSWHQHLVTMAGGKSPHPGFYLDREKYTVTGAPLKDPNTAFAQVDIIKPDESDFIKDDIELTIGCKIIGINLADEVVDPVAVYRLQYAVPIQSKVDHPVPLYFLIAASLIVRWYSV